MGSANIIALNRSKAETFRHFPWRIRILLFLIVLLSVNLQFAAAVHWSFWDDEAYTATVAEMESGERWLAVSSDVHPPLYVYFASAWGRLAGYTELGLRSLSVLFAALTLVIVFLLGRDLFDDRTALAATAILALSPLFIMFGYQARYYSLSSFFGGLVVLLTVRYHRNGSIHYLFLYILSATLYLYLVYASVIVIAMCNLWFLILWKRNPGMTLHRLAYWLGGQAVVGLACLPVMTSLIQVIARHPEIDPVINLPLDLLQRFVYFSYVYSLGETLSPFNPLAWIGAAAILLILLFSARQYLRSPQFWLAASFAGAIMFENLVLSLNGTLSMFWQQFPARNLNLLPFLAICLGAGLATLRPRLAWSAAGLLLIVYCFATWNFFTGRQFFRPLFAVPFREIFTDIRLHAEPEAVVLCGGGIYACPYFQERYGFQSRNAAEWSAIDPPPHEIWWIQTNYGQEINVSTDREIFTAIQAVYLTEAIYPYAEQDPKIRWAKIHFMGKEDYQYRVVVYQLKQR